MAEPPLFREEGLAEFVRASTPALLRTAYLLTGDVQLAEDLVQTALTKTARAWRRLHREGNALAYARRVLYHEQVSYWRRRRVLEHLTDLVPDTTSTVDAYDEVDLRIALRTALLRLPSGQRSVVVCRFFDDLSEAETADVLGMAIGTVKSQTHRGLAALRRAVPGLDLTTSKETP